MSGPRRPGVVASVVIGALLITGAPASTSSAHPSPWTRDLDVLASAHASAARPTALEVEVQQGTVRRGEADADAGASSSATCSGCTADSASLQVVYASRASEATLDNTANAWTQDCTGCSATALSVQVVVLRSVPAVVANNRALAVNAACQECLTASVAFQVVVLADRGDRLSEGSMDQLRGWFDAQRAALRTPPTTTGEATPRRSDPDGRPGRQTPGSAGSAPQRPGIAGTGRTRHQRPGRADRRGGRRRGQVGVWIDVLARRGVR